MTDASRPWLAPGLTPEQRVDALLPELALDELVGQLVMAPNLDAVSDGPLIRSGAVGSTLVASGALAGTVRDAGVGSAGLAAVRRVAAGSRLGIPILVGRDVIHGHRSVYPIPLAVAASFDEKLAEELAAQAADEAAADGIDWVFAPMLDVVGDPRWGRVAESFGESPALVSRLGAATVQGLQRSGRIAACAKHFVGYGLSRGGRDYAAVDVGEVALRNRYLPPFRAAVDAGCRTVMAAFSAVDGIPMHAHRYLLRSVLKEEWGFDGVVVADWNGIGELVEHGVAADFRDAARVAIEAGVDVDMVSGSYAQHLAALVSDGVVDRGLVEDAARRVLLLKARLGLLDPPTAAPMPDLARGRALAARAARSAVVLVAWDGRPPLPSSGPIQLTGPFVDDGAALLGTWVLDGDAADVDTPAAAFERLLGDRLVVDDARFADLAGARARAAAATVALVGEHPRRSGEDAAVSRLGLPAGQLEQLRLLRATAERLVVVVIAGRPLDLEPVLEVADVLFVTGHPGIAAGAIADVVAASAEPGGRLPATWPAGTGAVPGWTGEPPTGRPTPGRSRYLDRRAVPHLPLGAGRTWTTFEVGAPDASSGVIPTDGSVRVRVPVRNTGARLGRELVLLRFRDPVAAVSRPTDELADWCWVELGPGASGEALFEVPASAFRYWAPGGERLDPGEILILVGDRTLPLRIE